MASKKTSAATIYDVAERAGVSHQTVSRFLAGFEGIRPATRAKVATAVQELDYRPNLAARSLATNRSHRIAVLTGDLVSAGPSQTIQGVAVAARQAGYVVDIVAFDLENPASLSDAFDVIRHQDLTGVVALAISDEMREAIEKVTVEAPMLLDTGPADLPGPVGTSFNAYGLQLVVEHLVELGHRDIVHVTGAMDYYAAKSRMESFTHVVREHGLREHPVLHGNWSAKSGYLAVRDGRPGDSVTAIVCGNDQMALGAMRALGEAGLSCPADMSVTGFDDIPEAEYYMPPLTTVRIDFEQQGTYLFTALMARIAGDDIPDSARFMEPRLVLRASTAAPSS